MEEAFAPETYPYSVAYPVGVAEDVIVKVGKFHFPVDFVVVYYDVYPRVPLILGRPFLRTTRALVDVFGEELILRDGDEKLIFHADNTSKHPQKHANKSINMINFIDITCEDRFPKVLKKSTHPSSGSTTPLSNSLHSLTSFETSDSLLEEFADELALLDPFPLRIGDADFDSEGDILLLEKLLNDDPSSPLPPKELNFEELKMIKSSIDDSPPLDILGGNSVTFSNPLFDTNDDFTSSDDESLLGEDVPKENIKIYSNPLFEFDDKYISSGINPLFNEVLEDIENKDSYVSNLNEPALLVTPLFDEDECFDLGGDIDEIDADVSTDIKDGYHDSEGDIIYLKCLLINDTTHNLPPEVFLDHNPKSLKDEPNIDDLKIKENVRITFEDRHYLSLTFVIKIFLPFLTYHVNSLFLFSSGSEDTIFDPDISVFSFYSLEPMISHRSGTFMCFNVYLNILNESPMEICSSTCFVPNITMIWGESS
ncbi:reverse transcriptase domain-containing protein [Tanacetum coccineum]